jgi:predicted dehydrogenase
MDKVLTWGVLGTGRMAARFVTQVQNLPGHRFVACGSRSLEAATAFATSFNIGNVYGTYGDVLRDEAVEIVYVCLPTNLHREWSIRAVTAGKHVLCEKPLTVNYTEAEAVVAAARTNDVFLMEAFMYRCHPQMTRLIEVLRDGRIGDIRLIQASFSYDMGYQPLNIRMQNALAGGATLDVGGYPVSAARLIAGEEPVECKAVARIGPKSRVDEITGIVLGFPSGIVANLTCGMQVAVEQAVTVYGSKGRVHVPSPWFGVPEAKLVISSADGSVSEEVVDVGGAPIFALEAEHVRRYLDAREAPAMLWHDSLGNMAVLDGLRNSIGLHFDCE